MRQGLQVVLALLFEVALIQRALQGAAPNDNTDETDTDGGACVEPLACEAEAPLCDDGTYVPES